MTLKADGSFAEAFGLFFVVVGFGVFVNDLSVDRDGDFFPFDFNVVSEPLVVLVAGLFEVLEAVNAPGFAPVLVSAIDLTFVTLRGPAFVLELGVNEDPSIGIFGGLDFAFELEVFEFGIAVFPIKEVSARSLDFDGAILD